MMAARRMTREELDASHMRHMAARRMSTGHMTSRQQATRPIIVIQKPKGHMTTGHMTTGHMTTGYMTTGYMDGRQKATRPIFVIQKPKGHMDTRDMTNGYMTTGHMTTGHMTTGHMTTRHMTTGQKATSPIIVIQKSKGHMSTRQMTPEHMSATQMTPEDEAMGPLSRLQGSDPLESEYLLLKVSSYIFIDHLPSVAIDVGIGVRDLDIIKAGNPIEQQRFRVLKKWMDNLPPNFTISQFIEKVKQWWQKGYVDRAVWRHLEEEGLDPEILPLAS